MLRYILTIFLSAFLLFQVQPLIAKYILPWFGGSPAVWTTCMLFFQVLLLAGYCYAHVTSTWLKPKTQSLVHIGLLVISLAMLPIVPSEAWKPASGEIPTRQILLLLLFTLGAPYLLLSTTGPLLQKWFSRTSPGRSPYRLFALSNAGSLLALLTYPWLVEPNLGVGVQAVVWSVSYAVFVACCCWCAWLARESEDTLPEDSPSPAADVASEKQDAVVARRPGVLDVILWLGLSMTASLLLLAITNEMCQEIAVSPLLWVVPLGLYLLSFILTFESDRLFHRGFWNGVLVVLGLVCGYLFIAQPTVPILWQIVLLSSLLMTGCMLAHGELALLRPHPRYLTLYYLMISLGGAAGGVFSALIAPEIFNFYAEGFIAAGLLFLFVGLTQLRIVGQIVAGSVFKTSTLQTQEPKFSLGQHPVTVMLALITLATAVYTWFFTEVPQYDELLEYADGQEKLFAHYTNLVQHFGQTLMFALLLIISVMCLLWSRVERGRNVMAASLLLIGLVLLPIGVIQLSLTHIENELGNEGEEGIEIVEQTRNFYGVLTVRHYSGEFYNNGDRVTLRHGTIQHGVQYLDDDKRRWKTSYYGEESGIGLAIRLHPARGKSAEDWLAMEQRRRVLGKNAALNEESDDWFSWMKRGLTPVSTFEPAVAEQLPPRPFRLGVIGLGTGTLAAYGRKNDSIVFYEINPEIRRIAETHFKYLDDCPAEKEVVMGDARIMLEHEIESQQFRKFDVLAVDAFSSDAIPMHLLTEECFQLYKNQLADDGILAVHVSNWYLNLNPVVCGLADKIGYEPVVIEWDNPEDDSTQSSSTWILVTKNQQFLNHPEVEAARSDWPERFTWRLPWTDDKASVLDVIKAFHDEADYEIDEDE